MTNSIKKLWNLLTFTIIITIACLGGIASAAPKTVKMNTYDEVIKSGNYVYCNCAKGILKVNLKTKKVTTLENDAAKSSEKMDGVVVFHAGYRNMSLKGNYLYYFFESESVTATRIMRTNIHTGKTETLMKATNNSTFMEINDYAIKGNKLYVSGSLYDNDDNETPVTYVMALNGKGVKRTSGQAITNHRKTNINGYQLIQEGLNRYGEMKGNTVKCYLKTPSGKRIYLGKFTRG